MATFHFDEGIIEVPSHWSDRTVNILIGKGSGAPDFNLVMSRDDLGDRAFEDVVAEQMKELSKRMPGFSLLGRREASIGGVPGIEARIVFETNGAQMYQRMAALHYYDKALVFTATSLFKEAESCDAALARILASLMLRQREA
jgi:hypothetical protein